MGTGLNTKKGYDIAYAVLQYLESLLYKLILELQNGRTITSFSYCYVVQVGQWQRFFIMTRFCGFIPHNELADLIRNLQRKW